MQLGSDQTIHLSLSATALSSLVLVLFREFRPKNGNGNGMKSTLDRLASAIEKQSEAINQLVLSFATFQAREEGRRAAGAD